MASSVRIAMAKFRPFCSPATCLVVSGVVDELTSSSCPAVVQLYTTLQKVFGHSEFRPGQLDAAVNAMHGRDVFVQMSTGAGLFACFYHHLPCLSPVSVLLLVLSMLSWMNRYIQVTILGVRSAAVLYFC